MIVRRGRSEDRPWLIEHDDASEAWISRCVQHGEYFVAEKDGELVGFLRFSRFWGKIPYMDMIRVLPSRQHAGVGEERDLGSACLSDLPARRDSGCHACGRICR